MKNFPKAVSVAEKPSREEALAAVQTLIAYIGDDPQREGLLETPDRVLRAYEELYAGYEANPAELLEKTFEDVEGYNELVLVRDIEVLSHCEHHMLPIRGVAHVAYLPRDRVVGLSKLARLVEAYARRLQTQERLTEQVTRTLQDVLAPRGVAVLVEAEHDCMSLRGVRSRGSKTITQRFSGELQSNPAIRAQFQELLRR
ncbi:MAG: GTP cyclohydrolase I FolE [Myxococcota bacterium]